MKNKISTAEMMEKESISKVLLKLSVPAIIAMLINAIYNIVDTMFVGMLNNTSAIAAVSIVYPLFMFIGAIGVMFGAGGASYLSRLLGEKKKEEADRTLTSTIVIGCIFSLIFTVICIIFLEQFLLMYGATETTMPYAKEYGYTIVAGSIFTIGTAIMSNTIRAEGNSKYSMIATCIGGVINIILDPIFMFKFGMGIKGAAVATVISQLVSFIFLLRYYYSKKSYIKLGIKFFKPTFNMFFEILKIGIPIFVTQVLASFALGFMNLGAKPYGDAAVAAMGIVFRVMSIGFYIVFGIGQGFQPVAGYNYGAKNFTRLKEAVKLSIKWSVVSGIVISILFIVFAEGCMLIFTRDREVINIGIKAFRAASLLFPLFGYVNTYAVLYQALGKALGAFILSISRQGIFYIPLMYILPKFMGLAGVIFCQTAADGLAFIETFIMAIWLNKSLKKEMVQDTNLDSVKKVSSF
ncbi:MATE family efflux transporter [Clostridium botulinum]|uniref:Multidrug export protein MepA n=1 Tax=Clostridium botulinum (strain Hall / ATCC 3502 / NCTC 13319 / Type A) TaxID=441771 RepID=A5I5S6_CLOBH|nr:MATE family efflux transporter [Clostridium botulinum]EPS49055.1 MATE efflux family protein [Clostridium botulinum CFSAN002369]ABS33662.1 MATE efflux family protein [Clostridium botulinum A str. ATCC 19397]ABS37933.1 MATE efflux family protein [Clostridium botulinum A str. Hall]AWB18632.1 MATE family efflux transporter [Clostridium botulinum]EGT5616614.1 MATE family efflux transporter [Clostridium botulinum]